jgi:peptidyl-prolyl cis-trans isomerase D
MLDRMRQGAKGWVSKLLMILLVLSFAVWGIGGFEGYGAGTVAKVGDEEITVAEFARVYQQFQQSAQASGQQAKPEQVLNQLLLNAALDDEAREHNLGVSDKRVAQEIAADETFHGAGGGFDRNRFDALLENAGIRRDDFVRDIRQQTVREQLAASVATGVAVPQPLVEALYRFQNEERTVSFVVIDEATIEPVGAPDHAALQAYFDANKGRFRAPEYRKLGLLTLDPASLADPAAVTDEEVAAEYERRKPDLTRPERRRIEQIRFESRQVAEQALVTIQGGMDFAALARSRNLAPADIDLGMKTRAEILDPAVAQAGFAAEPNVVVPAIEGALEPSLIRVLQIEPGSVTPLEEVAPRIRQDLALRAAREKVQGLYDQIEDERAGGATLAEVAASVALPYRTIDAVARDGTAPDGTPVADLPAREQLLREAFESDVGVETSPIRDAAADSSIFFEVVEIIPERDRTLEESRAAVTGAWQAEEIEKRIRERSEALLARLQQGETLQAIGAEIGKPVQTVEGVKRGPPPEGPSANAVAQAFAGPEWHVANAESDAPPGRILLRVDRVTAPAFFAEAADAQAIRIQLAGALRNDILGSFNRQLLQERPTQVNNAAIAQLTGTTQTQ